MKDWNRDEELENLNVMAEERRKTARMPLERNRKPVQEFSEGTGYPTTGDGVNLPSELLIASREHLPKWRIKSLQKNN